MKTEDLIACNIDTQDLQGVPAHLAGAVLAGQLAAYVAGAMVDAGVTLEDIKAVGAFLSAAGTITRGAHVTFVDIPMNEPWEPTGAVLEEADVAQVLAIVSNQVPQTQPFMFPVRAADLLPIYVNDFNAITVDAEGNEAPCVRQQLAFHVGGRKVSCTNLGTKHSHIFVILET